jgi:hypothetical protein
VNPTSELDSYYNIPKTIRAGDHTSWPKFTKKTLPKRGDKDEIVDYGPVKNQRQKNRKTTYN